MPKRDRIREAARRSALAAAALLSLNVLGACASRSAPPLEAMDAKIELQRFMGDWYVIGFIPISIPFFGEEGAHNALESYTLTDAGIIETTYTFRDGGFDGPRTQYTPRGWVHDERTNTEWRMQFLWPFSSAYLIAYVDPNYRQTIVGVPDRDFIWIMARDPDMSDADYQRLLERATDLGYETSKIQRVPQRWP